MPNANRGAGVVSRLDAIPINYLARAGEVMSEAGFSIDASLTGSNLQFVDLQNSEAEIDKDDYYVILEAIIKAVDIDGFGLRVGHKFSVGDYGVLGYAFLSSPTLMSAIKTFFRYQAIVGSGAMFEEAIKLEDSRVVITATSHLPEGALNRYEVESSFGQWSKTAESISMNGASLDFTQVNFKFPKPSYSSMYDDMFNCAVYFGQPENQIIFDRETLDQRFTMANEVTASLCENQCQEILQNLKKQGGLVEDVRRIIINNPGQLAQPENIAAQLNMSYRTLRRRLNTEGFSFKQIHKEVVMGLATAYLRQTELSTQEIAFLVGYSEVANFHRAFKSWFNQTPGAYRQSRDQSI
jgi:AraC-like DNA-binding protein